MKNKIYALALIIIALAVNEISFAAKNTLYISGKYLMTPCGDTVLLRGVNNMNGWKADVNFLISDFPEIKKTGANCVRIVWQLDPGFGSVPADLDNVIQACINNGMVPIPELHDATSTWSKLGSLVDWWTSDAVVPILKKHEKYLMINIGNEVGDLDVTDNQYITGYTDAIQRIRAKNINCPLVIDAAGYGQNFNYISINASAIIAADPLKNIIFSIHLYYEEFTEQDRNNTVSTGLLNLVSKNIPFIVGEFSGGTFSSPAPNQDIDLYKTILPICKQNNIGYLAWEWHPGNYNGSTNTDITKMDMTSDGTFAGLKSGWATEVSLTRDDGISATSVTPKYIINKGVCDESFVEDAADTTIDIPQVVTDFIYLQSGTASNGIQVFSVEGISIPITLHGDYIDTSHLAAGLYFINIGNKNYKFLKL